MTSRRPLTLPFVPRDSRSPLTVEVQRLDRRHPNVRFGPHAHAFLEIMLVAGGGGVMGTAMPRTRCAREVTEGSSFAGGVWERARYDWSEPGLVRINVIESNAFRSGGSWRYHVQPAADCSTQVDLELVRRGRTLKGRLLAALLRLTGRAVFCRDMRKTLRALERA